MSKRLFLFVVVLVPLFALAQGPAATPFNAPTLAVLLANRPTHIAQEQWLSMMTQPVNRSLYPLRVTQAMLDTIDATQLDRRYQYVMVPVPSGSTDAPKPITER